MALISVCLRHRSPLCGGQIGLVLVTLCLNAFRSMRSTRGHELVAGPEALTLDIHATYIFRVNRFPVGYRHKRSCTVYGYRRYHPRCGLCKRGWLWGGLEQWLCALLWPFERLAAVGA